MSNTTEAKRTRRLTAYSALAGTALSAAPAAAAVVSQTDLNIVVTAGSPAAIDFGAGFGELFRFTMSSASFSRYTGPSSFRYNRQVWAFAGFNPSNTGGWTAASLLGYGRLATRGLPFRMNTGSTVEPQPGWRYLDGAGRRPDLFSHSVSRFAFSSGYSYSYQLSHGDWAPSARGFVGLRFTDDVNAHIHYAWIDVETDLDAATMTIHGWAYESTPNKVLQLGPAPVLPSAPVGALAGLAMGAAGIRRSRRSVG